MKIHRGSGTRAGRLAGWRPGRAAACAGLLGVVWTVPLLAQNAEIQRRTPPQAAHAAEPDANAPAQSTQGHGSISVGYDTSLVNGFRVTDSITAPIGTVRLRSLDLGIDYSFADKWFLHASVPFASNKFSGPGAHCPTATPPACQNAPHLNPPHPESQFLDDGQYHGAWQDWSLGVSYLASVGDYMLIPSFTASIPTHDYTFFANAAVGQDIWRVEPAVELQHQFDFSNLYYRVRYGYVYTESTLNTRVSHHRLDLELGYFINEAFSLRGFSVAKKGQGFHAPDLLPQTQGQTNDLWYHHDQISVHNYAALGVGLDYRFGGNYTLSSSIQKLVWGETIFNFRYSAELRLTRAF